ncbi:DUF983 domain-containing protein [Lewinella sp. 4G2]|uniref:DUF983 domain-containing protein n=1 Tax=Lewinella sp. 4G2 TaxID=1803372 RepID=UPI0007B4CCB8|nr:DUF983 domain-containing protein [Lewinella sp. 4G2]OAV45616.1 DUF983 domain-containing protein [Lewinella sp. 4G2]
MPNNPTWIGSVFRMTCPRCRRGDLFPTSSFSLRLPFKQYEHCPKCGQNYFPEPGFYYGAMFISYIGSGFFSLGFVMLLHWVLGVGFAMSFLFLLLWGTLFFVWWFRLSRSLYFHIVQKYRPQATAAVDAGTITKSVPTIVSGT